MAVKRKMKTGSGTFLSENTKKFREHLYKALYGSYERHQGSEDCIGQHQQISRNYIETLKELQANSLYPIQL